MSLQSFIQYMMVMMEFDNNDLNEDINDSIYRHDDSLV